MTIKNQMNCPLCNPSEKSETNTNGAVDDAGAGPWVRYPTWDDMGNLWLPERPGYWTVNNGTPDARWEFREDEKFR